MNAPGFKLVQLSDVHFGGEHRDAVEAAVERIQAEQPDLVIGAGDITKDGALTEFASAQAWFARLPQPQLITPGNHDLPYKGAAEVLERVAAPWRRYQARLGPAGSVSWRDSRATVVTLNSARAVQARLNWSKGAVSRRQVREVCAVLGQAEPQGLKIVACHHPLIEMIGGPMTARVRGGTTPAPLSGICHVMERARPSELTCAAILSPVFNRPAAPSIFVSAVTCRRTSRPEISFTRSSSPSQ